MTRISRSLLPLLILALSLALIGCGPKGPSLAGTEWRIIRWQVTGIDPTQFNISVAFADGKITGNSGINTYHGTYRAGPGDTFLAVPLPNAMLPGPEAAADAEGAFLSRLSRAATYKMEDRTLTLYDPAGLESLVFEKVSP